MSFWNIIDLIIFGPIVIVILFYVICFCIAAMESERDLKKKKKEEEALIERMKKVPIEQRKCRFCKHGKPIINRSYYKDGKLIQEIFFSRCSLLSEAVEDDKAVKCSKFHHELPFLFEEESR